MIYKIILIICMVLPYYSCFEKKAFINKNKYYKDFNPFTLEGINPEDRGGDSNQHGKLYIIDNISENKKIITIPCCNDNGQGAIREYNYDGRAWVWSFDFNIEGCHQYAYEYVYDSKTILLRYCGNPFRDAHYSLKSYSVASKESVVQYGFENEVVLNKMPWSVIDDNSILKTATYKEVSIYSLKDNNLLEKYYYNYYGVEIDIGPKQYEKKEYYDLGNSSIYQFFNCQYCFQVINKNM